MFKHISNLIIRNATPITRTQTRTARRSNKMISKRRSMDPGISRRMQLLNDEQLTDMESLDLDQLESDFSSLDLSYKQHVRETAAMKEREKYQIVRQKYFKEEKSPNFLTWNDKQQIKYLNSKFPETWTVDKLSEGFPALPEVIMKIIKSNYSVNEARMKKHDLSVQKNWEMFKAGKLEVHPELKEHLNKFTERKLNINVPFEVDNVTDVEKIEAPKYKGPFGEIIASYKDIKNKNEHLAITSNEPAKDDVKERKPLKETYVKVDPSKYKDSKITTLSELKNKLEGKVREGEIVDEDDELILQNLQEKKHVEIVNDKVVKHNDDVNIENPIVDLAEINEVAKNKSLAAAAKVKDYSFLKYPERIMIPKEKLKQGYTYKLNDCFYDSNGWFLYRVPGMVK